MKLHTDYSQQVVISTNDLPWLDSPMPSAQRRMLERDGEEVVRATLIVRYAPNSHFSAHIMALRLYDLRHNWSLSFSDRS